MTANQFSDDRLSRLHKKRVFLTLNGILYRRNCRWLVYCVTATLGAQTILKAHIISVCSAARTFGHGRGVRHRKGFAAENAIWLGLSVELLALETSASGAAKALLVRLGARNFEYADDTYYESNHLALNQPVLAT